MQKEETSKISAWALCKDGNRNASARKFEYAIPPVPSINIRNHGHKVLCINIRTRLNVASRK